MASSDSSKVPNTILLAQSYNEGIGQQQAYLANSWLTLQKSDRDWVQSTERTRSQDFSGMIEGVCWTFDGKFQKKFTKLTIDRVPSMKESFNVRDLMLYPIKFAESGLEDALRARGEMYWKCRQRNYVCYNGEFNDGIQSTVCIRIQAMMSNISDIKWSDPRFMIDIATYKQMHPPDPKKAPPVTSQDDLSADITSQENPPPADNFLLCLPKTIPGFNMNKKEWGG